MRKILEFENWKRFLISKNDNEVISFKNNIHIEDQVIQNEKGEICIIEKGTEEKMTESLRFLFFP
ncbi:hypothetical protein ACWNT8_10450 [Pigmentibacter ruber]|uniref:hypothetical protein n=1 Tax=Pigmentibacter ruber TaxID=2683196 RepID=UPI00131E7D0A|nr:hypothetical protein [Pigmentibacter ruber]BFD32289.1 hypothetical protein GTC16762_19070 [Pigmentibacter ruber]